jgi:superfamily I DNA and/or RNA helicase
VDASKHLILNNGKDITADVKLCQYNSDTGKYYVTFKNGRTYPYGCHSIEWVKNPNIINPCSVHISHGGRELFKIQDICVFYAKATDYWHIRFSDGREKNYDQREIKIATSCLGESEIQNCMSYLRQLATINELKSDDGEILLQKQYEKLNFVDDGTAMTIYLNPEKHKVSTYHNSNLIFPFGGNSSQFKAVENALNNQISVIQGPPGTGKTQTILNIIANLLIAGKTVQVVSNNNSATANVLEKLSSTYLHKILEIV